MPTSPNLLATVTRAAAVAITNLLRDFRGVTRLGWVAKVVGRLHWTTCMNRKKWPALTPLSQLMQVVGCRWSPTLKANVCINLV